MKKSLLPLLCIGATSVVMANESFGGIGVSLYPVQEGAYVAAVIPGTPASDTKIQEGDVIVAVNGISLKEKGVEFASSLLRGDANCPLEITYVSEGETYTESVRRIQLTVEQVNGSEPVALKKDANNGSDKRLVAVLNDGALVKDEAEGKSAKYDAVYVNQDKFNAPKTQNSDAVVKGGVTVYEFSRKALNFSVKSAGKSVVSIVNSDGKVVKQIVNENSMAGMNSIAVNLADAPSGHYVVSIEHNGSVSSKNVVLR